MILSLLNTFYKWFFHKWKVPKNHNTNIPSMNGFYKWSFHKWMFSKIRKHLLTICNLKKNALIPLALSGPQYVRIRDCLWMDCQQWFVWWLLEHCDEWSYDGVPWLWWWCCWTTDSLCGAAVAVGVVVVERVTSWLVFSLAVGRREGGWLLAHHEKRFDQESMVYY